MKGQGLLSLVPVISLFFLLLWHGCQWHAGQLGALRFLQALLVLWGEAHGSWLTSLSPLAGNQL